MMPKLVWSMVRLVEKLSLISKLALFLLLLISLAYLLLYRPQLQSFQVLKAQLMSQSQAKPIAANQQKNQLITYLAQFPITSARAASVGTLVDIAKQENILLDEITYKSDANADASFNRYHVSFSLFAKYAEVHHFLQSVLTQMPFVALETLNLSRETVEDELIEARIQLCFYFGSRT